MLRTLLAGGHSHSPIQDDQDYHDELGREDEERSDESTLDLRIIAVFAILVAGLLGSVPPLFIKFFQDPNGVPARILRAFSAGVILTLSIVHVIPEGMLEMAPLAEFQYGPPTVLFGIVLMVFLESASQILMGRGHSHAHAHCAHSLKEHGVGYAQNQGASEEKQASMDSGDGVLKNGAAEDDDKDLEGGEAVVIPHKDEHTLTCLRTNHNILPLAVPEQPASLRQQVAAYMFELGCVVHSFIIGLTLGVMKTQRDEVTALIVALSFHQCVEGMSLGSIVVTARLGKLKSLIMVLGYSLTTPAGVAIGIAVSDSYTEDSVTAMAVQGTLGCISGGMLLYISLIQLVAEELSRDDAIRSGGVAIKISCFVALVMGCFCMCLLANWA